MKSHILNILDLIAAVMEHQVFGWGVWVGIVVCERLDNPIAAAICAGLLATKTYLSGSWKKKVEKDETKTNTNPTV